jgi:hypothetical protein
MTDAPDTGIPRELAARLGEIVMRWSAAEGCLAHLLASLVEADPAALSLVTEGLAGGARAQALRALLYARLHRQDGIGEMLDHLSKADDLRADRDALADGLWAATGCAAGSARVHALRKGRLTAWLVTIAELDELIGSINQWMAEFVMLGRRLGLPRRRGETRSIFNDLPAARRA